VCSVSDSLQFAVYVFRSLKASECTWIPGYDGDTRAEGEVGVDWEDVSGRV
jgi:hypothetical protein